MSATVVNEAVEAVRRAGEDVKRDLRMLALYELPSRPFLSPPSDHAAEVAVLEALLAGRRLPSALACDAEDFARPIHVAIATVVEALEATGRLAGPPDLSLIVGVLGRQGVDPERAAATLVELRDEAAMRADVDELAERVRMLAERRRAIALMQRIDALWRTGHDAPAGELEALRAMLAGAV